MIEAERHAQPDKNSAKNMKEDNAWDKRVLEAPRTEENEESIVEMVRRLDQQFDKLTAKFQASMAAINKNLAKATEMAAADKKRVSKAESPS